MDTNHEHAQPLTGEALIEHHARRDHYQTKTDHVVAAGYVRPRQPGEPTGSQPRAAFCAYYEALLTAQGRQHATQRQSPGQLPLPRWEHTDHTGATPGILLQWVANDHDSRADPAPDQPLPPGAWWPLPVDHDNGDGIPSEIIRRAYHHARQVATLHGERSNGLIASLSDANGNLAVAVLGRVSSQSPVTVSHASSATVHPHRFSDETTAYHCPQCSDWFDPFGSEPTEIDGQPTCPDCADDADTCRHCGESSFDCDDQPCPSCRDSLAQCAECEDWYDTDDLRTTYGTPSGGDEQEICEHCCTRAIDHGNWHYDSEGDVIRQEPPQGWPRLSLLEYGKDPHTELGQEIPELPTSRATYGAELELDSAPYDEGPNNRELANLGIIPTQDGSLSSSGVELVTVALTAGEIRRRLSDLVPYIRGADTHNETGLHVHVDRRRFNVWQVWQLANYCAEHADILSIVAGRKANGYQNWRRVQGQSFLQFALLWHGLRSKGHQERYSGLNVNFDTVEFRCCQATTNEREMLARLDLIRLLCALPQYPRSAWPQTEAEVWAMLATSRHIRATHRVKHRPDVWSFHRARCAPWHETDAAPWKRWSLAQARAHARARIIFAESAGERHDATREAVTLLENPRRFAGLD